MNAAQTQPWRQNGVSGDGSTRKLCYMHTHCYDSQILTGAAGATRRGKTVSDCVGKRKQRPADTAAEAESMAAVT
jgi:hypothetical protein